MRSDLNATESASIKECHARWASLVEGIRKNEEWSHEALYLEFNRLIRYIAFSVLGSTDLVEDCAHDVYVDVTLAIQTRGLDNPAGLGSFIRTVAQRKAFRYMEGSRRSIQHPFLELDQADPDKVSSGLNVPSPLCEGATQENGVLLDEQVKILRECISLLGSRQRNIVTRHFFHYESMDQIAAALSIKKHGAESDKTRAISELRMIWQMIVTQHENGPASKVKLARRRLESMKPAEEKEVKGIESFTPQQQTYLKHFLDGHREDVTAVRMGLSPKTVGTYKSQIKKRLGIETDVLLVKWAIRTGITTL
jgi:RNA polymerase sigma factor (sigma-70 family)